MEKTPSKPRFIGFDLLRLLAVVLVLGRHLPPPPETPADLWRDFFLLWARGGWVGVDLFFVLSGFLVSGLLFAEFKSRGTISVARFYVRRGWKIYPPFLALIAATLYVAVSVSDRFPARALAIELLFLQSYLRGFWNHTWSLAVEEHFYLLLPITLALILRFNRGSTEPLKPILWVALGVAILALGLRLALWQSGRGFSVWGSFFPSHLRLDSLAAGVAIGYWHHFHAERLAPVLTPWRRPLVLLGMLLLAPAFVFELDQTPFIYTVGLTLFYLASGMLLLGVLLSDPPRNFITSPLARLGADSYSIYLWHMPVLVWGLPVVAWLLGRPLFFGEAVAAYLVGTLVVGVAMARIIERPALRLRDRWFPSHAVA